MHENVYQRATIVNRIGELRQSLGKLDIMKVNDNYKMQFKGLFLYFDLQ